MAALTLVLAVSSALAASEAAGGDPTERRQGELVRIVRQDCGSCHGMRLTGGLGPALTRERLAEWPIDSLVSVIQFGRPGTPMPGWRTMIDERDALWIARRLQSGFPEESLGGSR